MAQLERFRQQKGHEEASWRCVKLSRELMRLPISSGWETLDRGLPAVNGVVMSKCTIGKVFDEWRKHADKMLGRLR